MFLSGEREIRDTATALGEAALAGTEILPLYARLSAAEQARAFRPHAGRRIVLATNVAETSITVPGVRYVVDPGTARISRFSRRTKVQRLPIEPVSQASADQRAGRCGRVAPGVCIRLYDEDDYDARPPFTEPEILRTNLASVILQMAALGLGDVESFPFVDPPDAHAVRDAVALLGELGAMRDGRCSRPRPAAGPPADRSPLRPDDPRGRGQRLRPRGADHRRRAVDPGRGSAPVARRPRPTSCTPASPTPTATSPPCSTCGATWRPSSGPGRPAPSGGCAGPSTSTTCGSASGRTSYASSGTWPASSASGATRAGAPEAVHRSLLAGLLSHVGMYDPATREHVGARQARFLVAPGSVLHRRPAAWVMAGELVETTRLWARMVARIDPAGSSRWPGTWSGAATASPGGTPAGARPRPPRG